MVERLVGPLSASAMLAVSVLSPNLEVRITFFVASLLVAMCALAKRFTSAQTPQPIVEDDKHIILFNQAVVLDLHSTQCVHCGEVIRLRADICPRCKRSQNVLA